MLKLHSSIALTSASSCDSICMNFELENAKQISTKDMYSSMFFGIRWIFDDQVPGYSDTH